MTKHSSPSASPPMVDESPRGADETAQGPDDRLSSWSFALPPDLIARHPLAERAASRLLHLPASGGLVHRQFRDIVEFLQAGDVLVVNDTTVVPARLHGEKAGTGGRVEVLLVRRDGDAPTTTTTTMLHSDPWVVLLNASKKPKPGSRLVFPTQPGSVDALFAVVAGPIDDEPGAWRVRFEGDALRFAQSFGEVPLPPYLDRSPDDDDRDRYQTVYADRAKEGSVAAPTAGLHFDEAILAALRHKGVHIAPVTLHVGPGTFLPVHSDRLSAHRMHPEPWWMSSATAATLNHARASGRRIVAVGTTSARVLESARQGLLPDAPFVAGSGLTRIFLRPGHVFSGFDALVTNFHLPESTLIVLVGALVGRRRILAAYAEAVRERYRFYSYGDACLIEVARDAAEGAGDGSP
jgi:S-adenosylmethionine:tRNA ribosyltransferase-isomerase